MRVIDHPDFKPQRLADAPMWREIGRRARMIFADIPEDLTEAATPAAMLLKCYVKARCDLLALFLDDFQGEFTTLQVARPLRPEKDHTGVLDAADAEEEPDFFVQKYPPPRVILLVGDIGIGKSTYLWYHRQVTLTQRNVYSLEIHVGSPPSKERLCAKIYEDLRERVSEKITEYIRTDNSSDQVYFAIYEEVLTRYQDELHDCTNPAELRRLKREAINRYKQENPRQALRRELAYIQKRTNNPVFLFLDEVDRLSDVALRDYLIELARDLGCELGISVIIATRIYTRTFLLEQGFGGATYLILTLQPPNLAEVLKRRLEYFEELVSVDPKYKQLASEKRVLFTEQRSGFAIEDRSIVSFLKTCCDSLLCRQTLTLMRNLSNGNVRFVLDLVRSILESPYIDQHVMKLISGIPIPYHELLHIVTLHCWSKYNPEDTFIANLFDNDEAEQTAPGAVLVRTRVLQAVAHLSLVPSAHSSPGDVMALLEQFGYERYRSQRALQYLIRKNLIDTEDRTAARRERFEEIADLRLTFSGCYYLSRIIADLRYGEDVQDAVHWAPEDVPLPRVGKEPRSQKQERLWRLVERIEADESWEAGALKAGAQAVYQKVRGEALGSRLRRTYTAELEIIRGGGVFLEGEWNLTQNLGAGCTKDLGVGTMTVVRGEGGRLVGRINTNRVTTEADLEQIGKKVLIWVKNPPVRVAGAVDLTTKEFVGACDCAVSETPGGRCGFFLNTVL